MYQIWFRFDIKSQLLMRMYFIGDSLGAHHGMMFSTYVQDNDVYGDGSCAGAWWYESCHVSNLNGRYLPGPHASYADGTEWDSWHGYHYSLKSTTMMIRKL